MNKRTLRIISYILMLLPLFVTIVAMCYLPERIPAHYGFNGQVDRWGSKYESLILPVIAVAFGIFMLLMAKISDKMDRKTPEWERKRRDSEKHCLLSNIAALAIFNIMNLYFLYTSFAQMENLSETTFDIPSAMFALLGVLFIIVGAIMPKVHRNSFFGLRTK